LAHLINRYAIIGSEMTDWRVFHVTVMASRERHRQGRWSVESTTACTHEGGASFRTSSANNRFFQSHPTTKTGSFQSHPQSAEENALHFTCLACGLQAAE